MKGVEIHKQLLFIFFREDDHVEGSKIFNSRIPVWWLCASIQGSNLAAFFGKHTNNKYE